MDNYKLDPTDFSILKLLQQDGKMTYKELSGLTYKTHKPLVERVNRLHELGYIKSTVAILDIKKVKSIFTAFPLIQLKSHSKEAFDDFQAEIKKYPQIMECYHVTGQYDFILKIVSKDINAYNDFLMDAISSLESVANILSFPVLKEIKRETAYPL
jgi:Lrp/AsnC family leucine-responsive transcriptional regulator